ncbi:hypothetical protein HYV11_01715 [Candidatus Dependentiae bacterium]|nr:hypothetical protein [Candidatus Dependentiae bacterium]
MKNKMKKLGFLILLFFFVLGQQNCVAKFYTIRTQREFQQKIKEFAVVFMVFCYLDEQGQYIQKVMRDLSHDEAFNEESGNDEKVGILYIVPSDSSLQSIARRFGFEKKPIFVILQNGRVKIATTIDHHTVKRYKKFISDNVGLVFHTSSIDDVAE